MFSFSYLYAYNYILSYMSLILMTLLRAMHLFIACSSSLIYQQLHSEYRSTYRWHEFTGNSRPEVVRRAPAPNPSQFVGAYQTNLYPFSLTASLDLALSWELIDSNILSILIICHCAYLSPHRSNK